MIFIDALYGKIELDITPPILKLPELQRLREVRLCNVNSPYITGGSNINRFEHAIGTAYLAEIFCKKNYVDSVNKNNFIIASLLHDMVTPPFGHSLEYLFEAIGKSAYEHAQLDTLFKGKTIQSSRMYYMNKKSTLLNRNDLMDVEPIKNIILSMDPLSKYLINDIDIDNIDNVFRFAYHIGLKFNRETPIKLSEQLKYKADKIVLTDDNIDLINEWYVIRKQLYKYLLEDPGEFAAKAMLERTFIELINDDIINEYDWILVDFEFVLKALNEGNGIAKKCIQKYMLMDFPSHYQIFSIADYKTIEERIPKQKIQIINDAFNEGVFLHFIRDINKTQRPIKGLYWNKSDNIEDEITIGKKNDRYLIGLFSDKKESIMRIQRKIEKFINAPLVSTENYNNNEKGQLSLF